jgi:hypothetical protein
MSTGLAYETRDGDVGEYLPRNLPPGFADASASR